MKTEADIESALENGTPEISADLRLRILAFREIIPQRQAQEAKTITHLPRYLWMAAAASIVFSIFALFLLKKETPSLVTKKEEPISERTEEHRILRRGYALSDNGQLVRVVRRRSERSETTAKPTLVTVF